MHPLLDRHDMTRQRTTPAPAGNDAGLAGVSVELGEITRLLRTLLRQDRANLDQLCVTDREPPEQVMDDFPVAGARRLIVRRPGSGGSFPLAAAAVVPVLAPNENRIGGLIVNAGAQPVTLFLAGDLLQPAGGAPLAAAAPQIVLPAGALWNLLLGRAIWCGTVLASSTAGTTLSVAEV